MHASVCLQNCSRHANTQRHTNTTFVLNHMTSQHRKSFFKEGGEIVVQSNRMPVSILTGDACLNINRGMPVSILTGGCLSQY